MNGIMYDMLENLFPGTAESACSSLSFAQWFNFNDRRGINPLKNKLCNSVPLRD